MNATFCWSLLSCVALAVIGAAGCGASSPSQPGGEVIFSTLQQTSIPAQAGPEVREAVRDQAAWNRVWVALSTGSSLPATPPAVDFGRDMVIATAMATQPCVAAVTVRRITRENGGLVVDLLEEPPGPKLVCFTTSRPIHVVRLERSDLPVRFAVTVIPRS